MDESYKAKLKVWGAHVLALVVLSILLALVQRWLGVTIEVPPPPVTVIVEPAPGTPEPPKVTVFNPIK